MKMCINCSKDESVCELQRISVTNGDSLKTVADVYCCDECVKALSTQIIEIFIYDPKKH